MKKRVVLSISLILAMVLSFVGCIGDKGITSKDFSIVASSIEGNSSKHSVVVKFEKTNTELKYYLYQNGEEIATGEVNKESKSQEYILENTKSGDAEYKLKVVSGDDELIKETTYSKASSSSDKTDESEKVDSDKKDDENSGSSEKEDESKPEDKPEESTTTPSNSDAWSGESKEYVTGDKVKLDGVEYECINGHTSQEGWSPKDAASLWKKVE